MGRDVQQQNRFIAARALNFDGVEGEEDRGRGGDVQGGGREGE